MASGSANPYPTLPLQGRTLRKRPHMQLQTGMTEICILKWMCNFVAFRYASARMRGTLSDDPRARKFLYIILAIYGGFSTLFVQR